MDNNANYTLVGAFVIVLISAIILTIIWLSSGLRTADYARYILFSKESVSGLNIDAPVEYNGVNVGQVEDVTLNKNNPHLVTVLLKIKSSTPITQGTVATLTSRGVTGIAFIALKDESTNLAPIRIQPGQPYPVIPTTPSIFMRLDTALTAINNSFQTVSKTFAALLDQENLKSIKEILISLDTVSKNLAGNTQKLNILIDNTSKASQQLTPLISSGRTAVKTFESETLPSANQLMRNLNEVARNLNEISNQVKRNPSMLIRGSAPPPPGPGE